MKKAILTLVLLTSLAFAGGTKEERFSNSTLVADLVYMTLPQSLLPEVYIEPQWCSCIKGELMIPITAKTIRDTMGAVADDFLHTIYESIKLEVTDTWNTIVGKSNTKQN